MTALLLVVLGILGWVFVVWVSQNVEENLERKHGKRKGGQYTGIYIVSLCILGAVIMNIDKCSG